MATQTVAADEVNGEVTNVPGGELNVRNGCGGLIIVANRDLRGFVQRRLPCCLSVFDPDV